MKTMLNQITDEAIFEEEIHFNALLLYDRREHAELAKEIFNRLCARLSDAATTRLNLWSFDSLEQPQARNRAGLEATDADVIIVSTAGTAPLPAEVKTTLEEWALGMGAAHFGLVVLLSSVAEEEKRQSPVYAYIEELAAQSNFDWFSRGLARDGEEWRFVTEDRIETGLADQDLMTTPVPSNRWGIND